MSRGPFIGAFPRLLLLDSISNEQRTDLWPKGRQRDKSQDRSISNGIEIFVPVKDRHDGVSKGQSISKGDELDHRPFSKDWWHKDCLDGVWQGKFLGGRFQLMHHSKPPKLFSNENILVYFSYRDNPGDDQVRDFYC
jgi:hypothetical protein